MLNLRFCLLNKWIVCKCGFCYELLLQHSEFGSCYRMALCKNYLLLWLLLNWKDMHTRFMQLLLNQNNTLCKFILFCFLLILCLTLQEYKVGLGNLAWGSRRFFGCFSWLNCFHAQYKLFQLYKAKPNVFWWKMCIISWAQNFLASSVPLPLKLPAGQ